MRELERESGCVIGRLREGDMTQLKCVKERESETTKKVLSSKDRKLKKSLFVRRACKSWWDQPPPPPEDPELNPGK